MATRDPNALSRDATGDAEDFLVAGIRAQEQGRLPEAAALFDQVLRIAPNHPDAQFHCAMLALQMDRPDVALPMAERLAAAHADSAIAQNLLGVAYRQSGRLADAIARLRVAVN